jgi:hypothetical protein
MEPNTEQLGRGPDDNRVGRPADETLTEAQEQALADADTQEKYRIEYLRQLRQRSCPGCGETDLF